MYQILTIDLKQIKSINDLHLEFAKLLKHPENYCKTWHSLWENLTGQAELPTNIILCNFSHFSKLFPIDAELFSIFINQYNDLKLENSIFQFDRLEGLKKNIIRTIFKTPPSQFGLRGDDYLWEDLESYFSNKPFPESESLLIEQIHTAMEELTGSSTLGQQNFFVRKYSKGGMSSGVVSHDFWEKNGIPLLIGHYRKINANKQIRKPS